MNRAGPRMESAQLAAEESAQSRSPWRSGSLICYERMAFFLLFLSELHFLLYPSFSPLLFSFIYVFLILGFVDGVIRTFFPLISLQLVVPTKFLVSIGGNGLSYRSALDGFWLAGLNTTTIYRRDEGEKKGNWEERGLDKGVWSISGRAFFTITWVDAG